MSTCRRRRPGPALGPGGGLGGGGPLTHREYCAYNGRTQSQVLAPVKWSNLPEYGTTGIRDFRNTSTIYNFCHKFQLKSWLKLTEWRTQYGGKCLFNLPSLQILNFIPPGDIIYFNATSRGSAYGSPQLSENTQKTPSMFLIGGPGCAHWNNNGKLCPDSNI